MGKTAPHEEEKSALLPKINKIQIWSIAFARFDFPASLNCQKTDLDQMKRSSPIFWTKMNSSITGMILSVLKKSEFEADFCQKSGVWLSHSLFSRYVTNLY